MPPRWQRPRRRAARLSATSKRRAREQSLFQQGATAALLRVGGLPLALATLMPEVLHRCRGEWPELVLQLREATGRQFLRDIQAGIVDCGLGRLGSEDPIEHGAAERSPELRVAQDSGLRTAAS